MYEDDTIVCVYPNQIDIMNYTDFVSFGHKCVVYFIQASGFLFYALISENSVDSDVSTLEILVIVVDE